MEEIVRGSQEAIGSITSALLKTDSLMGMILLVILCISSLGLEYLLLTTYYQEAKVENRFCQLVTKANAIEVVGNRHHLSHSVKHFTF